MAKKYGLFGGKLVSKEEAKSSVKPKNEESDINPRFKSLKQIEAELKLREKYAGKDPTIKLERKQAERKLKEIAKEEKKGKVRKGVGFIWSGAKKIPSPKKINKPKKESKRSLKKQLRKDFKTKEREVLLSKERQEELFKRQEQQAEFNILRDKKRLDRMRKQQESLRKDLERKGLLKERTLKVVEGEYLGSPSAGYMWYLKNGNGKIIFRGNPKERIIRIARKRGYIVSDE